MELVLIRFKKDGSRRDLHVRNKRIVFGRGDTADIKIPKNDVSREHCEVRVEGDKVIVKDLGSSNGTFVNDERIEGEHVLNPGDRLSIGTFVLTAQIDGEPSEVEPPLLESPVAANTAKSATAGADDSDSDLSDLIAQMGGDAGDSSVFEMNLDDSDI